MIVSVRSSMYVYFQHASLGTHYLYYYLLHEHYNHCQWNQLESLSYNKQTLYILWQF